MKSMVLPSSYSKLILVAIWLSFLLRGDRLSSDSKYSLTWQIKLKNTIDQFPLTYSPVNCLSVPISPKQWCYRFDLLVLCMLLPSFFFQAKGSAVGDGNGTTYRGSVFSLPPSPFYFPIQNSQVSLVTVFESLEKHRGGSFELLVLVEMRKM